MEGLKKRTEKFKRVNPPMSLYVLGSYYLLTGFLPMEYKDIWPYLGLGVLTIILYWSVFEQIKGWYYTKWTFFIFIAGVGILLNILNESNDKMGQPKQDMSFSELYSKLVVAPLYLLNLILCILFLIFCWKDKGFFVSLFKVYALFIIVNYLIALYFRFFS